MPSGVILQVENLTKEYHRMRRGFEPGLVVRAVDGVSFEVGGGEIFGLVGESGSGKTTVAKCVLGLIKADRGSVWFQGEDLLTLSGRRLDQLRMKIQAVFQDPDQSLNPRWQAGRIIEEPLIIQGGLDKNERKRRVLRLLEDVGLDETALTRLPHEFSGGQRQRIAIGRALASAPDLIVADEPVSSLDAAVRVQILQLLSHLRDRLGLTLLFISHELSAVRQVCDRVAVMYRGKIVEIADSKELFENPKHPYTRRLLAFCGNPIGQPK